MFKTTVNFVDFNDVKHTEELCFNMMTPEFVDLEFNPTFENEGGLGDYIRAATKAGDMAKIYTFFKLMIVNSYGRRSEDGSEFIKSDAITEKFLNSRAYEEFFVWLIFNPKNAEAFWNSIVPEKILGMAEKAELESKKKIKDMSKEELVALYEARLAKKGHAEIEDGAESSSKIIDE